LGKYGGNVLLRHQVVKIQKNGTIYTIFCKNGTQYQSKFIINGIPPYNFANLLENNKDKKYLIHFHNKNKTYRGAVTMGIVHNDTFPDDFTLHHQVILKEPIPYCNAHSIFISFSAKDDYERAPKGKRVLAISIHADNPKEWLELNSDEYIKRKEIVESAILTNLESHFPNFKKKLINYSHISTPKSWQDWTLRVDGGVGGIPQSMNRSLLLTQGSRIPDPNIFMCGDAVYPGQGIPGVTLSGILAADKILKKLKLNC
jgi:phytoene dehydrogenase-like protein